jgi:hypothetical protein
MARIRASVVFCVTLFASCVLAVPVAPALSYEALDAGDLVMPGIASPVETRSHHNSYWLGDIDHNGASPYNNDTSFVVYRNVMEYVHKSLNIVLY